jgi:hypothetical protein
VKLLAGQIRRSACSISAILLAVRGSPPFLPSCLRVRSRLANLHGFAIIALGLSISLDELAIRFSLGLIRLRVAPIIIAIAIIALVPSQLGLALGSRISELFR